MKQYFWCGRNSTPWWTLKEWLRDLEPFKNAPDTFRGVRDSRPVSIGWLNRYPEDAKRLQDGLDAGMVDYIIYSYKTPIAWHHRTDGWIDPGHGYSQATKSKHYGPVKVAIAELQKGN